MLHYLYPQGKIKAMTFSYDDGNEADRRLVEIFNQNGMKGTFHLNSGTLGRGKNVTPEELPELYKGHEVSAHSLTHPFLERVPEMTAVNEMIEDRCNLEHFSHSIVRGMSYPMGTYTPELVQMLRELGFVYSRTVESTGKFNLPGDFLMWHPTCHHVDSRLMDLGEQFKAYKYNMGIFYLWGHSYEFNLSNNWNVIEDFCKSMRNLPDVWYATNIEIYNYVTALKQLDISYDQKLIFNRSAFDLYIGDWGKVYKIVPGVLVNLAEAEPWGVL